MAVCFLFSSFATDYYVYYLGGQSNMDGYGYTKDLPKELSDKMKNIMIFHGNTAKDNEAIDGKGIWAPLQPGHGAGFKSDGVTNQYSDRFGLELTFAQHIQKLNPDKKIAIIKYSRGGTSIDSTAAGDFGCWDPDFEGKNGINQYDHFLATLNNAFSVSDIDGDGEADRLIPAGILWMQGESDAGSEEVAMKYYSNLKRLLDLIRAALRSDDLPVAIGMISDSRNDDDKMVWNYLDLVQYAEVKYTREDKKAALVISTENYDYSDKWHYDSNGYIDLGKKFAESLESIK